ncbi:metal-dependent phosphohydrolase [Aromatoleum diolicum]|uniref:Metal-dependent phosphohydrolase n=1 Tax=Aromatoleum diolicum TaxID=75796 RepID=A0ABX1QH95_9RHOO|nr:metal-dependent phosphohydrolase [Aromatoleum diolicum]NMG76872.1 metal-dependent phosphohydrolase [Aromatoleum diolicum]
MKQDFPGSQGRRRVKARAAHSFRPDPYSECTGAASHLVRIEDIAHALASTCCFAGQTKIFYSIAQHDYLVSMIVPPQDALAALLLNAGEALKQLHRECLETEGHVATDVLTTLGVPTHLPPTVKHADLVLRATELRDLGRPYDNALTDIDEVRPLVLRIQPLPPIVAKHLFLDRYNELRPKEDPRRFPTAEGAS